MDRTMPDRPIAVDLFAGAGGMSLGLEQAGFDVACALEWDRVHAAAHRFNFPHCSVLEEDATKVSAEQIRRAVAEGLAAHGREKSQEITLVAGGPPCQGFSVGGVQDPKDPRNLLVGEFARLVLELKPKAFLFENVPAMASRDFQPVDLPVVDWLKEKLSKAGYSVGGPFIVNASWYGVPQDRRRLFIVGALEGALLSMPTPTSTWHPRHRNTTARPGPKGWTAPSDLPPGPTAWGAIGDIPNLDDFEGLLSADSLLLAEEEWTQRTEMAGAFATSLLTDAEEGLRSHPRQFDPRLLTASLRTVHRSEVVERFSAVAPGDSDPVSRFIRIDPIGLAPTLRAGSTPDRGSYSAPRPIHPIHDRVISVREAARLHGFPDWFRFTEAKWHGFRQVGNAVCPPVARRFGESALTGLAIDPPSRPESSIELGDRALLRVSGARGTRKRRSKKHSVPLSA